MDIQLKRYKKEYGHSYSLGVFPTLELLLFRPRQVVKVLVDPRGGENEGIARIEAICARERIPVEANEKAIERIASKENSYAVGVFRKYEEELGASQNHVVLVNPGDMGNLGAIIRTMAGFGVGNLAVIRPAADVFDPKVIRASMGAIFRLSFQHFETFEEYRGRFDHSLYPFMTDGETALDKAAFKGPYALVFGNESAGLPEEYRSVGTSVTIPHSANIDSLNLPVAVGIGLYHATAGDFSSINSSASTTSLIT